MLFLPVLRRSSCDALVLHKGVPPMYAATLQPTMNDDQTPPQVPQSTDYSKRTPHATARRAADRPDPNLLEGELDRAHDPEV